MPIEVAKDNDIPNNSLVDYPLGKKKEPKISIALVKHPGGELSYQVLHQSPDIIPDQMKSRNCPAVNFKYVKGDDTVTIIHDSGPRVFRVSLNDLHVYIRGRDSKYDTHASTIGMRDDAERDKIHDLILEAFAAFADTNYFCSPADAVANPPPVLTCVHSF